MMKHVSTKTPFAFVRKTSMPNRKTLTFETALKWKKTGCNTSLGEHISIEDNAAEVLASCDHEDLDLDGLTELSPAAAKALSKQKSGSLSLGGLRSLLKGAADHFASYVGGSLGFDGLKCISESDGLALSKSVGSLHLSGLI